MVSVQDLMSRQIKTCMPNHTLDCAARNMWDGDCGVVPVVGAEGNVVGMITDRDICIAALTQNKLLNQIVISSMAMRPVVTIHPRDSAQHAESLMQRHQLRRLAVIDDSGKLVGILSLNDLARAATRHPQDVPGDQVARTLAAIGQPHGGGRAATI